MSLQIKSVTLFRYGVGIALAVLGLLCWPRQAARGDGGVFTTTKHGHPTSGIQRLIDPDAPRGTCVQCHSQHASAEGSPTGTPNPYLLFAPNDNALCATTDCHAGTSTNHIYQGSSVYDLSYHASVSGMIWPGPIPWARRSGDIGKCINCHDPHGYSDAQGLMPAMTFAREQSLCLSCHDGSPAHTNISSEITKVYRHPAGDYAGRHSQSEGSNYILFGQSNRHAECEDCHNVHTLKQQVSATAPNASESIKGVSYVSVSNGPAWTTPLFTYHAPDDPQPVQYEYQLCFKCHSSWTVLPLSSPSGRTPTDKSVEFNPNNPSYHPVEAPGKQTGIVIETSLLSPYTAASIIYCTDCHASDFSTAPSGPHGSTNRFLLKKYYAAAESRSSYTASDYALCYSCHDETALLDTSGDGTKTNFTEHNRHLTQAKGNQPTLPTCASCHGNTHGSPNSRLVDFTKEPHVTSFTSWTSKAAGGGTGNCTLTCHGHEHNANY